MGKELEYKYELPTREQLDQVLDSKTVAELRISDWEILPMETSYYDTPEGALSNLRWTLRHRLEGGKGVACLKIPSDDPNARNEYETEAEAMDEGAQMALIAAGAPKNLPELADLRKIRKVCGAEFTRRVAVIRLPDGTKAYISGDWGKLYGGERAQQLCEIEVELTEGSENGLKSFCALLAAEFGLQLQPMSKFARARALTRD